VISDHFWLVAAAAWNGLSEHITSAPSMIVFTPNLFSVSLPQLKSAHAMMLFSL